MTAVSVPPATLPVMLETLTDLATSASAVVAVLISSYVLRLQLRDKQELQRDREREHASRVSCWADWSSGGVPVLSGAVLRHPVVTVANRTDEPVFGAFVDYRDQTDGHPIRVDVGTVPPGNVKSVQVEVSPAERSPDWQPEFLLPALYFRDTRNRWWHRDTVGYLKLDPGAGNDGFFESGGTFPPTPPSHLTEPPAV
jgi:hypothetical protein